MAYSNSKLKIRQWKKGRPVVWTDAEELLEAVLKDRSLFGNYDLKVMAYGGQGFFKICMTVLPENFSPESDCGVDDSDLEADSNLPIKNRILYSEGGSTSMKAKLISVHRLLILCAVPQKKKK